MIQFEHFETANDIMIRFSGVSILFSVQNQLKLHRKINCRLKNRSQLEQRSVYRDNKYTDKLADNYDFMPKVVVLDDAQHIIDIINETAQKYGQYYQQHDAWNHEADNLTHRPGAPWSIAHAKGKTLCWAMMIFWNTTRWNDCNLNISKARAWCELFSFRLVIIKEAKLRKNEEYGLWKFWLLMTIKTSFNY